MRGKGTFVTKDKKRHKYSDGKSIRHKIYDVLKRHKQGPKNVIECSIGSLSRGSFVKNMFIINYEAFASF